MVDVKIPKIFNIDKSYVIEHLDGFIQEIAYNFISGELHNKCLNEDSIDKLCYRYYWNKFNKTGKVIFTHEEVYKHNMDNGRKRFKDSCYVKIDWIVFIDALDKLIDVCTILSSSLHMQNPEIDEEVKKDLMYSVIIRELLQEPVNEESDGEIEKDKITEENDQKRLNP